MKLHEIQNRFLLDLDIKENSKRVYNSGITLFFLWLHRSGKSLFELKRTDIIEYKKHLQKTYKSSHTVRNHFKIIQLLFAWLSIEGIYNNITLGIKKPKHLPTLSRMPLFEDEIQALLNSIDKTNEIGLRDYVILRMMISMGLRVSEITQINISDFDNSRNNIVCRILGKGCKTKSQVVSVSNSLWDCIEEYIVKRQIHKQLEPLFISYSYRNRGQRISAYTVQTISKHYLSKIGLTGSKYSAHSLRHTTATNLILAGKDIRHVQLYMRHKSPATTEIYYKWIQEHDRLNNSIGSVFDSLIDNGHINKQKQPILNQRVIPIP